MFSFKNSSFDKLLEKATSHLLLEPDIVSMLAICDQIRAKDVTGKYAITSIRKKIHDKNPNVQLYALEVLEICVKNCGSAIHDEIATKEFMTEFRDVCVRGSDVVKKKILGLIQAWAHVFKNESKYRSIYDTFMMMKHEGYTFPEFKESAAMFTSENAPEWAESTVCHRCRVSFGPMTRKHHCRHCGQVFCNSCASKQCTIPKFGIEKEVRVCLDCHKQLRRHSPTPGQTEDDSSLPLEYVNSPLFKENQQPPPPKTDAELKEEEELQLALAMSLDEETNKNVIQNAKRRDNEQKRRVKSHTPYDSSVTASVDHDLDPDLARYLNRSYWEEKSADQPTAPEIEPVACATKHVTRRVGDLTVNNVIHDQDPYQNGEHDYDDQDRQLTVQLQSQLEIFVNRMKSCCLRDRPILYDSQVQSLFTTISSLHPTLLQKMHDLDDQRTKYEGLQDKVSSMRDARAALDALREEHREKIKRISEEEARLRQIQMVQKLESMREKKQEFLECQRQIALQRLQEQERDLQLRVQAQKQQQQQKQFQQMQQFQPSPVSYPYQQSVEGFNPGQQQQGYGNYPGYQNAMFHNSPGIPPVAMMGGIPQQYSIPMQNIQQPQMTPGAVSDVPGNLTNQQSYQSSIAGSNVPNYNTYPGMLPGGQQQPMMGYNSGGFGTHAFPQQQQQPGGAHGQPFQPNVDGSTPPTTETPADTRQSGSHQLISFD